MEKVPQRFRVAILAIFLILIADFVYSSSAFSASLPANFSCTAVANINLQKNDSGLAVKELQIILNSSPDTTIVATGPGSPGNETGRFGQLTYLAVIKFQNKYASDILTPIGLTKGTGFVGTTTRIEIAKLCTTMLAGNVSANTAASHTTQSSPSFASTVIQTASATLATLNQRAAKLYSDIYNYMHTKNADAAPTSQAPIVIPPPQQTVATTPAPQTNIIVVPPPAVTPQKTVIVPPPATNTVIKIGGTSVPSPAPIVPVITPHAGTLQWGAYVGDSIQTDLPAFESLVGKPVNIVGSFFGFSDSFPLSYSSFIGQKGKTLLIFWEPSSGYDTIINGSQDSQIKKFAADAKTYGYPVILDPFNEMNLAQEAWGFEIDGNTAAKFKSAWQHIHDIFVQTGASNVKFAIDYNNDSDPNVSGNQFSDYYPGSAYVDYVGIDGFNFGGPWQTSAQVFDTAMAKVATFGKPIYILSTASAAGTQKAAWIADFGLHIKAYSNIVGWVWFNENKEADWRVNSDTASLQAFKTILP